MTFPSDPHSHASARPIATTFGSLPTRAISSFWIRPRPQAFSGCVVSVQLVVSTKLAVCPAIAGSPLPDWMLNHATLKVGLVCARALEGMKAAHSAARQRARGRVYTITNMREPLSFLSRLAA